ncbi:WbqC family protein [Hydrogenimonas urashimensis]|uniref:WbqC family protein n=1 Tax=Hydrogenimonas urashimensis TaxID=2740515 RepID=UPI001915F9CF|nr:WbqC family protein [Hydrogenimonas urashimensis]
MKIGIMQPYFFPYIGYYQLMEAVDTYVIADDLNYIKNGYINKNSILLNNQPFKISLQLFGASQNKLINQIEVGENGPKLLSTIKNAYKKAPFFKEVFPLLEDILLEKEKNLGRFLGNSLMKTAKYLEIEVDFLYSSEIEKDNSLKFDERIYDICHRLNGDHYINAIGGQKLYSKEKFAKHGIRLNFIQTHVIQYKQFNDSFVPNLSIIDVMMFNSKKDLKIFLNEYSLV